MENNLPIGFAFALAQNPDAMKAFSTLAESKRTEILQKAQSVSSRDEMRSLVDSLSAEG